MFYKISFHHARELCSGFEEITLLLKNTKYLHTFAVSISITQLTKQNPYGSDRVMSFYNHENNIFFFVFIFHYKQLFQFLKGKIF